jgi:DMSO/TMAO reductase YedYZ molybdopterin-dependent catalytic subunit
MSKPDIAARADRGPEGPEKDRGPDTGRPIGRRVILSMLGLGTVGVVFGKKLQSVESSILAPIEEHDPTGLTSLVPAGDSFRFYSVTDSEPNESPADYKLTVNGLVDRPVTLTMADLANLPQTSLIKDFQCVTGWRVPGVHWSGVAMPDLLKYVGVKSSATALAFGSFDGTYTESLSLSQAMRRDVLVATSMLGGPVSRAHGGPVRLYVAPMYGYKSCKWLGSITLANHVTPGYWENEGYDVDGWVGASNGRSDAPTS